MIKSDKSGQRGCTTLDLQPTKICKLTGRYLSFTGRKWSENEATGESDLLTLLRSLQAFISWAYEVYHVFICLCTLDSSCIDDCSTDTYTGIAWGPPLSPGPLRWGMPCVVPVDCSGQLTFSKIFPCVMSTRGHSICVRGSTPYTNTVWPSACKVATWRAIFDPPILRKSCKKIELAPLCHLRGINSRFTKQLLLTRLVSSV